jgi:hypothetical protein
MSLFLALGSLVTYFTDHGQGETATANKIITVQSVQDSVPVGGRSECHWPAVRG